MRKAETSEKNKWRRFEKDSVEKYSHKTDEILDPKDCHEFKKKKKKKTNNLVKQSSSKKTGAQNKTKQKPRAQIDNSSGNIEQEKRRWDKNWQKKVTEK